jgi:hypothetical protein
LYSRIGRVLGRREALIVLLVRHRLPVAIRVPPKTRGSDDLIDANYKATVMDPLGPVDFEAHDITPQR